MCKKELLAFFVCGFIASHGNCIAMCHAQEGKEAGGSTSISGTFDNSPLLMVVEDVVRQSGLHLPVRVSPGLVNKRMSVSFRGVRFWEAIIKICTLTESEIVKQGLAGSQTLNIRPSLAKFPVQRVYGLVPPFCFEMAMLGETARPEVIRNTWRIRFLGLREDGDFVGVSRLVIRAYGSKQESPQSTIPISDYRGDIVRTVGGTYDEFLDIPRELVRGGFSCKTTVDICSLTERQWLAVELRKGAQVDGKGVHLTIDDVSNSKGTTTASYVLSWPTGQGDCTITHAPTRTCSR